MSDELKPVRCGCGGEAKVQRVKTLKSHVLVVMCTKCEIATNYYTKEAEAVTAWNRAMGAKDINVPDKNGMSDLISINDALKITTKVEKIHPYKVVGDRDSYSPYNEGWNDCVSLIESYLEKMPVVEPKERKKGKWVRRKDSDCWECSECHAVLENDDLGMHNFYFCYHCGANMMNKSGYMDIEEVHYG